MKKDYEKLYREQLDMNGCLSDKIEELEKRVEYAMDQALFYDEVSAKSEDTINEAINYIFELKSNDPDNIALDKLLNILGGDNNE